MMTKNQFHEREQLEMLTIDHLVPKNHLVRKLELAIDFSFIYPLVENLYSGLGRPSIDPVVIVVHLSHSVQKVRTIKSSFSAIFGRPFWKRPNIYAILMR
jgi:hypothetical protein